MFQKIKFECENIRLYVWLYCMDQDFRGPYTSTLNSSEWVRRLLNIKSFAELHLVLKAFTKASQKLKSSIAK